VPLLAAAAASVTILSQGRVGLLERGFDSSLVVGAEVGGEREASTLRAFQDGSVCFEK
jgi:hypothetical protein